MSETKAATNEQIADLKERCDVGLHSPVPPVPSGRVQDHVLALIARIEQSDDIIEQCVPYLEVVEAILAKLGAMPALRALRALLSDIAALEGGEDA